jgi:uncharacterized protein (TIGR02246 family)
VFLETQKTLFWMVFLGNEVQMNDELEVHALYQELLERWNERNAQGYADLFLEDGGIVGFDGSTVDTRAEIFAHLAEIFTHHATAEYVAKIRSVRFLNPDVAVLSAVAGLVPPGGSDINPAVNAVQTLVAQRKDQWRIALFQNTPAAFHGRPELGQALTKELQAVLEAKRSAQ